MGNSLKAGSYFPRYRVIASLLTHICNLYLFGICYTCTLQLPHCPRSTPYQNKGHSCPMVGPRLSTNPNLQTKLELLPEDQWLHICKGLSGSSGRRATYPKALLCSYKVPFCFTDLLRRHRSCAFIYIASVCRMPARRKAEVDSTGKE